MKTILISIYPEYSHDIFVTLLKKIELRKFYIKPPFKAMVYEPKKRGGNGKVIGEFIVNEVDDIFPFGLGSAITDSKGNLVDPKTLLTKSCLTEEQLEKYLGKKGIGYGYHITAPKLYDKPVGVRKLKKHYDCRKAAVHCRECNNAKCHEYVTHPPQNYMYIQDTEEEM